MNQYSELMGSFIRNGDFPLEANYIFPSEDALKAFYEDTLNATLLHLGWLKVVATEDEQSLWWVVMDSDGNKTFLKLISADSLEDLYQKIEDLREELIGMLGDMEAEHNKDIALIIGSTEPPEDYLPTLDYTNLTEISEAILLVLDLILDIYGNPLPSPQFRTLRGIEDFVIALSTAVKAREGSLQEEINQTQLGAGLNGDGTFDTVNVSNTNYIKDSKSIIEALKALDAQISNLLVDAFILDAYYDPDTEDIVMSFNTKEGVKVIRIDASGLIREWEPDNTHPTKVVELTREVVKGGGADKLSADVRLAVDKTNILEKKDNTLIVRGTADNIVYNGDVTVKDKIDLLELRNDKVLEVEEKLNQEIDRSIAKDNELSLRIDFLNNQLPELDDYVKYVKIPNNSNPDRKAIALDLDNMILGGGNNLIMLNKWGVVDLGTPKSPINLNTPAGVRPTVQEEGVSGEDAELIAYLSDLKDYTTKDDLAAEIDRAKQAEAAIRDMIGTTNNTTGDISDKLTQLEIALKEEINRSTIKDAEVSTDIELLENTALDHLSRIVALEYYMTHRTSIVLADTLPSNPSTPNILYLLPDNALYRWQNGEWVKIFDFSYLVKLIHELVEAEKDRAEAAETTILNNLNIEIDRATIAENEIRDNIAELIKKILVPGVTDVENAEIALGNLGNNYSTLYNLAVTVKSFLEDKDVADSTINKWLEIEDFLSGITDQLTLTGLLNDVRNDANQLISAIDNRLQLVEARKLSKVDAGTGNVVSSITVDGHEITVNKGISAVTGGTAGILKVGTNVGHTNSVTAATKGSTSTTEASGTAGAIDIVGGLSYDALGHITNAYTRRINLNNTTYTNATSSSSGLMSATDKLKLDSIASSANNYSLPVATTTVLGGVKAGGSNITIAADGTISAKDTTYSNATLSAAGLLSATDKAKLDGIASGANNYSHPTGSAANKSLGLYKISTDGSSHVKAVSAVTKEDITALGIPGSASSYTAGAYIKISNGVISVDFNKLVTDLSNYFEPKGGGTTPSTTNVYISITDASITTNGASMTAAVKNEDSNLYTDLSNYSWPNTINSLMTFSGNLYPAARNIYVLWTKLTVSASAVIYTAFYSAGFSIGDLIMCFVEGFTMEGVPTGVDVDGTSKPGSVVRQVG